jgi:hypothetical protein
VRRTHGMFLLLDLQYRAILEAPLDNIRLLRHTLHPFALLQLAPEGGEILQLDEMPDGAHGGFDNRRFGHGGGGRDSRHCDW